MRLNRSAIWFAVSTLAFQQCPPLARAADSAPPTTTNAATSASPYSASLYDDSVDATVTREGSGTVSASLVPSLQSGDVIKIRFTAFEKPANPHRFHANYAVISGSGVDWMDSSGEGMQLFTDSNGPPSSGDCPVHVAGGPDVKPKGQCNTMVIHYDGHGVPVVFIMPEDYGEHRGMKDVRRIVGNNGTDIRNQAQIASETLNSKSYIDSLLSALGGGAIDVTGTGKGNATNTLSALGAAKADIDACYTQYTNAAGNVADKTGIDNCLAKAVSNKNTTGFDSTTIGNLALSFAGKATPYISGLATIAQFVVKTGKAANTFEYLPAPLVYVTSATGADIAPKQELSFPKQPHYDTVEGNPPDVVFFAIGPATGTGAAAVRPTIALDTPAFECVASDQAVTTFPLALHLKQSSTYTHETAVVLSNHSDPKRRMSKRIIDNPLTAIDVDRSVLSSAQLGSAAVLDAQLNIMYGFTPLVSPTASVVLPSGSVPWSASGLNGGALLHHHPTTVYLTSSEAPCAKQLIVPTSTGDKTYDLTVVDATHAQATNVVLPEGTTKARVVLAGQNNFGSVSIKADEPLPSIDPAQTYVGDRFFYVTGKRINTIKYLGLNGALNYLPKPANGKAGCFIASRSPHLTADVPIQLNVAGLYTSTFDVLDERPPKPAISAKLAFRDTAAPIDTSGVYGSNDLVELDIANVDFASTPDLQLRLRVRPNNGFETSMCAAVVPVRPELVHDYQVARVADGGGDGGTFYFKPSDAFGVRGVGTLQAAIYDKQSNTTSDWVDIPNAKFVSEPAIDHIQCDAVDCSVYGTNLSFADGIGDGTSAPVPLLKSCPQPDSNAKIATPATALACAKVPKMQKYVLYLGALRVPVAESVVK